MKHTKFWKGNLYKDCITTTLLSFKTEITQRPKNIKLAKENYDGILELKVDCIIRNMQREQ